MKRLAFLALLAVSGCMCVQVPDVRYACESSSECLSGESCVGRRCVTTPDASLDAGVDAGVLDAGTDAGEPDAGEPDAGDVDAGLDAGDDGGTSAREDCTNKVDDDGDNLADCLDDDCRNQICRPVNGVCDAAERCNNLQQCPMDVGRAVDSACDDSDVCTAGTTCQPDGGCGKATLGELIAQCEVPDGIHNMIRGTTCVGCSFTGSSPLFREIPDAGLISIGIYSRFDDAGVCDGCGDWHITSSPGAMECGINTVQFAVSPTAQPGLIPVFQFRATSGPGQSAFGLDAGAPPSGFGVGVPVFWACPP